MFFHLHHPPFIPPVPYPPLRGTFPSRGRLTIRGYRHLTCSEAATSTLVTSQRTPLFSLLPLEGGAPKGRRLALEAVFSHAGMPTPPRFARLPLPEEGARMIFKETLIQSLSFAVRDSRFPPTYAAHFSVFLISLSYRQCPIRPFGAPSPQGEGSVSGIPLSPSNLRPFGAPPSKGRREKSGVR